MTKVTTRDHRYPVNHGVTNTTAYYEAISTLLDTRTKTRISELVDLNGATCIDVVTGRGNIAEWLSEKVGDNGHVMTTDFIDRTLPRRENLGFLRHDLCDSAGLGGPYDFINARLVLAHLPNREHVLHRLLANLAKGGVILTQDWWMIEPEDFVIEAPTEGAAEVLRKVYRTYCITLQKAGYSSSWAADAREQFINRGLLDVDTQVHGAQTGFEWRGGSPGTRMMSAAFSQQRGLLIANGVTSVNLDRVRNLLLDPLVAIRAHQLYLTSGRKPGRNHYTRRRGDQE